MLNNLGFLETAGWKNAVRQPLAGDASTRRYFRLRTGDRTAILMDARGARDTVAPYLQIARHLVRLGFSAPEILAADEAAGLVLLEDFGDQTLAQLLDAGADAAELFTLGVDVLIALHKRTDAVPPGLRGYSPEKMLDDVSLYLACRTPSVSEAGKAEFARVWLAALRRAHQGPASLLLRDYHMANVMLLPGREGVRRAGLLDFQDAYQGPVAYDLVSLLEDARRDLPPGLKAKLLERYRQHFPALDREMFQTSAAILAALRHARVLAVFEKLSREGKSEYQRLHSPRVERLLAEALQHPALAEVKNWFNRYGG